MSDPQKLGLGFPKLNDPTQIINRNFPIWPQPPPPTMLRPSSDDPVSFQAARLPNPNRNRMNWNNKKAIDRRNRSTKSTTGELSGYQPQSLNDLQFQNRVKTRRFYPKKNKFVNRFAPYAPRNTTSFIIRAKKSGGIASLISPCPVTPAILPTPKFSPSREGLVDMAKEEWGVDGYGSMKGLIRLRSGNRSENMGEDEEDDEDGSTGSDSDVEEHLEVEKRLDHDLSRFEMVYPSFGEDQGAAAAYILENRVDDQDASIAKLEEENLTLKERMFLMEREMSELRMRVERLENININNVGNHHDNNNIGSINVDETEHEPSYSDNNVNLNGNEEVSEGDDCVCSEDKNVGCDGDVSNENLTREE